MGIPQLQAFVDVPTRKEGQAFEQLVLGPPAPYVGDLRISGSFQEVLVKSIKHQPPGYPWGNPPYQIRDVFRAVQLHLPEKDRPFLMLFSTLGTPLDKVHGADCFFHLRGAIVSVDLTLSMTKKIRKYPAHLFFTDNTLGSDDLLRQFANNVALHLVSRTFEVSFWAFQAMMRHRQ